MTQLVYHGLINLIPMRVISSKSSALSYMHVFGKFLCDIAKIDDEFVQLRQQCAGSGMVVAKLYPREIFDVGIAEQHAITFAGGAATKE